MNAQNLSKKLYEILGPGDVLDLNDPKVLYLLIEISEQLVLTDPVISMAIYRASRYPIVDFNIIIDDEKVKEDLDLSEKIKNKIDELINKKYYLRNTLINLLVDYYTYGIGILNIEFYGKRILKCPKCNFIFEIDLIPPNVLLKDIIEIDNENKLIYLKIKCSNCKNNKMMYLDTYSDDYVYYSNVKDKILKDINLRLWSVKDIEILYEPFTKTSLIKLNRELIKQKIKEIINNFDIGVLNKIEYNLLKWSLIEDKKEVQFYLDSKTTFTLKYNLPTGIDLPFFPLIARGYRGALILLEIYRLLVNYSQEIIPYRLLFSPPQGQLGVTPVHNISKKSENLRKILKEIDREPLKLFISDTPYEKLEIGGNIQNISILTQLMEMIYTNLIGITDLPKELIMEGTWASNVISIRLLENSLLNITIQLNEFLQRFSEILSKIYNFPKFTLSLIPPRRIDSLSEFQLLFQILQDKFPKELLLKTYYGMELKDIYQQISYEQELDEKYNVISEFRKKLLEMKYINYLQDLFSENTDEQGNIDYDKVADEIIEQTQGNRKKIVTILESVAQEYGEDVAHKLLEVIEQKLQQMKQDKKGKDKDNKEMPVKSISRRDDVSK
jgi:predicted nucleic-acid-binding Zn-ribbon protein